MKDVDKKVSIIIPCYNAERYVEKCINSIIIQTHKDIEIIAINDGSTDNTINILKKIEQNEKRLKIIDKENTGVSDSRNLGIEVATGTYIMFVDADDWIKENTVEILLEQSLKEDADIVRGKYIQKKGNIEIREDRNLIKTISETKNEKGEVIKKIINGKIQAYCVLLFFKKEFLKQNQIRFNKSTMFLEDKLFYIDCLLKCNKFIQIEKYIYYYNINQYSVVQSMSNIHRKIKSMKIVHSEIKKKLYENRLISKQLEEDIDTSFFLFLTNFLINIYISNINPFDEMMKILTDKDLHRYIMNANEYRIPKKEKIMLILIRQKKYRLLDLYLRLRRINYKIKHKKGKI